MIYCEIILGAPSYVLLISIAILNIDDYYHSCFKSEKCINEGEKYEKSTKKFRLHLQIHLNKLEYREKVKCTFSHSFPNMRPS